LLCYFAMALIDPQDADNSLEDCSRQLDQSVSTKLFPADLFYHTHTHTHTHTQDLDSLIQR
jgi:hypothetical protein